MNLSKTPKQPGYVTLTAVLLLLALSVSALVGLTLIAVSNSKNTVNRSNFYKAKAAAESCAELTLNELRTNYDYVGPLTLNLSQSGANCTLDSVTGSGGTDRTVRVLGEGGATTVRLVVTVNSLNPVEITSWEYVEQF